MTGQGEAGRHPLPPPALRLPVEGSAVGLVVRHAEHTRKHPEPEIIVIGSLARSNRLTLSSGWVGGGLHGDLPAGHRTRPGPAPQPAGQPSPEQEQLQLDLLDPGLAGQPGLGFVLLTAGVSTHAPPAE